MVPLVVVFGFLRPRTVSVTCNLGAVYSLKKQRCNHFPRLLQLFYAFTWNTPMVYTSFWLPRDHDNIAICDMMSKPSKFDSINVSHSNVYLNFKGKDYVFQRLHFPFEKIIFLLDKFLSEWQLFRSVFLSLTYYAL